MTRGIDRRMWLVIVTCVGFGLITTLARAEPGQGMRPPWTTSRIFGSPNPPEPYKIVEAFPKLRFENPTSIEEVPGAGRLLITEMGGRVFTFPKQAQVNEVDMVVDLRELLGEEPIGSVSLFDAEFHPEYAKEPYVFLCYVHPADGGHTRVSRFTVTGDAAPKIVPDSERVVIAWPSGGHNAGCLEFGKDGYLYIATGDGSGPNPPDGRTTGQTVDDLLGAILRIDVNRPTGALAYSIPTDNPFVNHAGARPEIWAYGLRNPWKIGVDLVDGDVFAADNGWETWEMVHRIVRGGNCGWPVMEGRAALRTEVMPGPTPILPPVKDHPHTEANSVIGGPVYRGSKLPGLDGTFVYGDYITGTIWSLKRQANETYMHATLVDTDQRIVAFTQGSQGELYVLDYDFTGQVYELMPSGLKDTSADFPRRLSETGLFESLGDDLSPAAGVVPYEVQAKRWMDGASAQRWVAIPADGRVRISMSKHQSSEYPEGTVFVKHLNLSRGESRPPIRLETQILHYERGQWHPYSYLWDDAGRDAELVEPIGADRMLNVNDPAMPAEASQRTWHVSATNECKLCHNAGSAYVLGFSPHQLNVTAGNEPDSQLSKLFSQGVIAEPLSIPRESPGRLVDPQDISRDLNDRGRSYLHANCGMCHHPGGNAIVSFYLNRELPFDHLNTNKGTGIGTFGMRDAKIIVPGDPYRSVLMYRMSKLGYGRMPYIGSRLVDSQGVALVDEWIRSLDQSPSESGSAPTRNDSAESTALRRLAQEPPASPIEAEQAILQLLSSTEGSLSMLARMHRGHFPQAAMETAAALGSHASKSDVRGLFETFIPESQRRAVLGPNVNPETVLSLKGDRARGQLIFFSDSARCRGCHARRDADNSLGPTLAQIAKKYPRRSDLLQHVLQPSLKIEDQHKTFSVTTKDGRVQTGLVVQKTGDVVVIKTAEQKKVRIAADTIDEMELLPTSLMPMRLLSDLTPQEAADLIEFIMSP